MSRARSAAAVNGYNNKKNAVAAAPVVINHQFKSFMVRSLDRNDQELAALQEIHLKLDLLKEELQNRHPRLLLEMGRGKIRLVTAADTVVTATANKDTPTTATAGADATQPQPNQQPSQALSSPPLLENEPTVVVDKLIGTTDASIRMVEELCKEKKLEQDLTDVLPLYDIAISFLLHFKLRRRLLNRLARRLLRVSHAMDTLKIPETPPLPTYGDAIFVVDPLAAQELEQKRQRQEDLLRHTQKLSLADVAQLTASKQVPGEQVGFKMEKMETEEEEPKKEGEEKDNDPEEDKDADSEGSKSVVLKAEDRRRILESSLPRAEYQPFIEYKEPYEKEISVVSSGNKKSKKLDKDGKDNAPVTDERPHYTMLTSKANPDLKEDYQRIPLDQPGIGANPSSRFIPSASERLADFSRFKTAMLSKIPNQPTLFAEPHVFYYKKRLAKAKEDEKEIQKQKKRRLLASPTKAGGKTLKKAQAISPNRVGSIGKTLKRLAEHRDHVHDDDEDNKNEKDTVEDSKKEEKEKETESSKEKEEIPKEKDSMQVEGEHVDSEADSPRKTEKDASSGQEVDTGVKEEKSTTTDAPTAPKSKPTKQEENAEKDPTRTEDKDKSSSKDEEDASAVEEPKADTAADGVTEEAGEAEEKSLEAKTDAADEKLKSESQNGAVQDTEKPAAAENQPKPETSLKPEAKETKDTNEAAETKKEEVDTQEELESDETAKKGDKVEPAEATKLDKTEEDEESNEEEEEKEERQTENEDEDDDDDFEDEDEANKAEPMDAEETDSKEEDEEMTEGAVNDEKEEEEDDEDCQDPVKRLVRPLSLVPTPSFYDQDLKRTQRIHSYLVDVSIRKSARSRMNDVARDYNQALTQSTSLNERRMAMQNRLNEMVQENQAYIAEMNKDYAEKYASARANWVLRRNQFDQQKLNQLMPQRHNPQYSPQGTNLTNLFTRQPNPDKQAVGRCLGSIVDAVDQLIAQGKQRDAIFRERFCPPSRPDTGFSHKRRMEDQIRQEIGSISNKLRSSEEERRRAWKKMMKSKAENGIPHHHQRTRIDLNLQNYSMIPIPPLHPGQFQTISHETARSSAPAYGTYSAPVSRPAPAAPAEASAYSKYSTQRVRARISEDGSVAPVTAPKRTKDGLYVRPAGRTRKGMIWDAVRGIWVPESGQQG